MLNFLIALLVMLTAFLHAQDVQFGTQDEFYKMYDHQIDELERARESKREKLANICTIIETIEPISAPNSRYSEADIDRANFSIASAQILFEHAFRFEGSENCVRLRKQNFDASSCERYWHITLSEGASDPRELQLPQVKRFTRILNIMGCPTPKNLENE